MGTTVVVVQHGEKERVPGESGLTELGRDQARTAGAALRERDITVVVSSPMRRALETAQLVAEAVGVEVETDERFRERMNWDGSEPIDSFLEDWHHASTDRDYTPRIGDSSRAAGDRFVSAMTDHAQRRPHQTFVVVAHGGVTTDGLRTIVGDGALADLAPSLVHEGVPCGAFTTLVWDGETWQVSTVAVTEHLESETQHRPA